ncbi:hypothetical protein TREES_T100012123 [Tupaia chinensis]|uniref:Uncharacterized protein n=1 Tax=Tupaia chinensis TaxID=246437 RepID=L9K3N0_TUPCH|nr:hypothetical protein TREES_T100012123 [Tupaia chinensis]
MDSCTPGLQALQTSWTTSRPASYSVPANPVGGFIRCGSRQDSRVAEAGAKQGPHDEEEQDATNHGDSGGHRGDGESRTLKAMRYCPLCQDQRQEPSRRLQIQTQNWAQRPFWILQAAETHNPKKLEGRPQMRTAISKRTT